MTFTGQQLVADRIPGERIETSIRTSSTSSFTTTETVVDSVTAPLVSGRTYRIRWFGTMQTTVADGSVHVRLREDDAAGNQLNGIRVFLPVTGTGFPAPIEAEYTAGSTGDKTFVATGDQITGGGQIVAPALPGQPAYLYVDYIRG